MKARGPWIGWGLALVLTVAGGCIRNQVVVRVNPDGSGDILVTRVLSRETVQMVEAQMDQMRAHMGGMGAEIPEDPFYNEEALKQEAVWFGSDVVFVNARKIDRVGTRGSLAHYRFDDIREIVLRPEVYGMEAAQRASQVFGGMGGVSTPPTPNPDRVFSFEFEAGETARLTVRTPVYPELPAADSPQAAAAVSQMQQGMAHNLQQMGGADNPYGLTGQESPAEMMAKLYKDAELSVTIDILGDIVETDARYPDADRPTRFTLLRVMPEQLAQTEELGRVMAGMSGGNSMAMFSAMFGLPDTRIETNRTVSVEFK